MICKSQMTNVRDINLKVTYKAIQGSLMPLDISSFGYCLRRNGSGVKLDSPGVFASPIALL